MKKILFITKNNPFEPHSGASQRSHLMLDALTENNEVDLVCFTNDKNKNYYKKNCSIKHFGPVKEDRSKASMLFDILKFYSIFSLFPKNRQAVKIISKLISESGYDFVITRYVSTALKCGLTKGENIIIDIDDQPEQWFMSQSLNDQLPLHWKIYYWIKSLLGKYYTRILTKNIYHSFIPNSTQVILPNSSHLPNIPFPSMVPTDDINSPISPNLYNILIVGSMSYEPNYFGVDYFISNIWKKIKQEVPEAVLNIVGRNLPVAWEEKWNNLKDINYKGFVHDLFQEYAINQVVVAPIYHGSGTNIKVLEAMKMKKATVISGFAARGFEEFLKDSENILIAQNDDDFAQKVVLALKNKKLNKILGLNASDAVNKHFSFEIFKKKIQEVLD